MEKLDFNIIIPARLKSTRLPRKVLHEFFGLPMLEHVRRRALLVDEVSRVIVATCDDEIYDLISSYGGDVYSMLGMIDYIRNLPVKVNTHCLGASMSAAAVMLACGTGKRTMSKNSSVMIHEGSAFEVGKTSDVLKGADHLKLLQKSVCNILGVGGKGSKRED